MHGVGSVSTVASFLHSRFSYYSILLGLHKMQENIMVFANTPPEE